MNTIRFSFVAVLLCVQTFLALPAVAAQGETAALKDCTVRTKVMAKQFSGLAHYMSRSAIKVSKATSLLEATRVALGHAKEACAMFPEMMENLGALSGDIEAIGRQIGRR